MKTLEEDDLNNKKKKKALKFSILIFVLVLILGSAFFGIYYFLKNYENRIYPQITIANQSMAGKTKDEARQILLSYINKLDQDGPEINYKTQILNPKFSQLGVSFDIDGAIREAYSYGRDKNLWVRFKSLAQLLGKSVNYDLKPVTEEKVLAQYFDFVSSTVNIAPKNSTVIFSNNEFSPTESEDGIGLNQKDFSQKIQNFINGGAAQITLETTRLEPEINPEDTQEAIKTATNYLTAAPLTLAFEAKTYTANRTEIANWIIFNEESGKLTPELSRLKINSFIEPIAKEIEIAKVDKEVVIETGKVINEGSDGRGVDKDKIYNDLVSAILNGNKSTKITINTFVIGKGEKKVAAIFVPGEYSGRYLDINLSLQILQLIDNHKVIQEHQVSTGKWSMPTPVGVRYIESKSEMAWSNKYQLYMPWWNSIGGGYGIHELPMWPNGYHEGESHLGTPVSHGCIRLGIGPAETVYNWAPIGTPVNIHK